MHSSALIPGHQRGSCRQSHIPPLSPFSAAAWPGAQQPGTGPGGAGSPGGTVWWTPPSHRSAEARRNPAPPQREPATAVGRPQIKGATIYTLEVPRTSELSGDGPGRVRNVAAALCTSAGGGLVAVSAAITGATQRSHQAAYMGCSTSCTR